MPSQYLMQIIHKQSGEVVQFAPGQDVEMDFIDTCVQKIMKILRNSPQTAPDNFVERCTETILKRGVGFMHSETHVAQDIRDGLNEAVVQNGLDTHLKDILIEMEPKIASAIAEAIFTLKAKVKPV